MSKLIIGKNDLATLYPELAKEWHPTKNGDLTPQNVTAGSDRKVWWLFPYDEPITGKHFDFEWEAVVCSRTRSGASGCPFLSGHQVWPGFNDLQTISPKLAKEWHPSKNYPLTPNTVGKSSAKNIWWLGKCGHEWENTIQNRLLRGDGCPICSGHILLVGYNDLATTNPDIAKEWHPTKNGDLTPQMVSCATPKAVWWYLPYDDCATGKHFDFEWQASIANRGKRGDGCPFLNNKKVWPGFNDLATTNPELAQEWDYEKNAPTIPCNVIAGTNKKIYWKCSVCGHKWAATGNSRISGHGCPVCARFRTIEASKKRTLQPGENDLETMFPELLKEWCFEKNEGLNPGDVTCGSGQKVWWKCKYGHEWQASIYSRVKGAKCPLCHSKTSYPEQAIFYYIKQEFPDAINRCTDFGFEIDIYVPCLKIGIEYDGIRFHKNRRTKDEWKSTECEKMGIRLIRVREKGLDATPNDDTIWVEGNAKGIILDNAIIELLKMLEVAGDINNERDRVNILEQYYQSEIENSVEFMYPMIADEWDYEKNKGLSPDMFSYGSTKSVWWKCTKGHSWSMSINARTSKKLPCPFCSGKRAWPGETDFATLYPELLKEWNCKNALDPHKITPKTDKKVSWKCDKGHEWEASVISRTRLHAGCPFCSGKMAIPGATDMFTTNPEAKSDWDYEKNKDLDPTTVKSGSDIKVWWKCVKCGMSYKASPYNHLIAHTACPYCANQVYEYTKANREGELIRAKNGEMMKIVKYRKAIDIDVQFEDGTIVEHKSYYNFKKGLIKKQK